MSAKKTVVASALKRLDYDPVAEAVRVARYAEGAGADPRLAAVRAKIACDLLQYVQPKLRSIELTGKDGGPVQLELFDWKSLVKPAGQGIESST